MSKAGKRATGARVASGRKVKAVRRAAPKKKAAVVTPDEPVVAAPPAPLAPKASDTFLLTLEASCTLRETADLQFSLVAATGDPLVIDGGAVQRIDTAGLQLLVALARRQHAAGGRLEWKAASPELLQGSRQLGLVDALGLASIAGTVEAA